MILNKRWLNHYGTFIRNHIFSRLYHATVWSCCVIYANFGPKLSYQSIIVTSIHFLNSMVHYWLATRMQPVLNAAFLVWNYLFIVSRSPPRVWISHLYVSEHYRRCIFVYLMLGKVKTKLFWDSGTFPSSIPSSFYGLRPSIHIFCQYFRGVIFLIESQLFKFSTRVPSFPFNFYRNPRYFQMDKRRQIL